MSKKSKSVIPEGSFSFDTGTNYGLDGFFAEMTYGEGIEDAARLPETKDLEGFLKEGALADLSWLDVAEQDLDRLPKSPHSRAIKELEQAWGVSRRTDGLQLIPNVDKEVMGYEVLDTEGQLGKKASQEDLLRVGRWAMRMAFLREPMANIVEAVNRELGQDAPCLKGL